MAVYFAHNPFSPLGASRETLFLAEGFPCALIRWFLTRWALVLLLFVVGAAGDKSLYAGCHYGRPEHSEGSRFKDSTQWAQSVNQSTHGHARDFHFLGQWIYEAGEIKYVPWQDSSPCRGPHCHADGKDDLPNTGALPQRVVRPPQPTFMASIQLGDESLMLVGHIEILNACTLAGYPHEREYPPEIALA